MYMLRITSMSLFEPPHQLKVSFINLIKTECKIIIGASDVDQISVRGASTKHLKVHFTTHGSKMDLIRAARTVKPEGLYCSDYLTTTRSNIFYKLRCLRKVSSKLEGVFVRNGTLACRLVDDSKIVMVANDLEYRKLEGRLSIESCAASSAPTAEACSVASSSLSVAAAPSDAQ